MVSRAERLVYEQVRDRDIFMWWTRMRPAVGLNAFLVTTTGICTAPLIDRSVSGTCSGRVTFDHVHAHAGGTKAKRAPTSPETLVSLCEHHHLWSGWATSHRPELRVYIKEANEDYEQWRLSGRS